jgi:hypothetical protein
MRTAHHMDGLAADTGQDQDPRAALEPLVYAHSAPQPSTLKSQPNPPCTPPQPLLVSFSACAFDPSSAPVGSFSARWLAPATMQGDSLMPMPMVPALVPSQDDCDNSAPASNPARLQGFCNVTTLQGSTRTWGCTCKQQYRGPTCALFDCPSNCSWAGTCLEAGVCSCYPGFTGPACETDCKCNGHGSCAPDGTCRCDVGWRWGAGGCEPDCGGANGAACAAAGEDGCQPGCQYGSCFGGRCECWAGAWGAALIAEHASY